ncbi:hypothetical protein A1O1_03533 [Capronia coronata CBS 617.96]|uniref:Zn(2)-C6 fungal-type domain-containing protein n=1 Tax=Capronia coronata CBS 617.96 TaxID=1182541 RepID=W9YC49_9EURO|nr:uncharacterized protein A1O1_03533 [Capronia coronata CBS 617.96]EXJ90432.1 hypothetical protein A1O1_03533 [Capronia coronata CBS 617.96]
MDSSKSTVVPANDDLPLAPPKKRKLKHPRTARACLFCRRRKVRCTGTQPCDYCRAEGVRCEYDDGVERVRPGAPANSASLSPTTTSPIVHHSSGYLPRTGDYSALTPTGHQPLQRTVLSTESAPRLTRNISTEPPQTFAAGQHIGPTAGVSFLYHVWNRSEINEGEVLPAAPLTCYGDMPQPVIRQDQPFPTQEEATALLERYFRFATPTYRFLHQPTLERWMSQMIAGARLPVAEAACALIVCAQSLLYSADGDRYKDGGDEELVRSRFYFEKAKSLLNQEPGPATVVSVQARLAMCLYLLSSFRINESRFCFSLACTILTSIGLHRKTLAAHKLDLVTLESRKRTFWCAYVLDDYLSVMLGRPRTLRDEEIDQPYPRNIDDQDLLSSESPEELPQHGNLEGFIAHANLAKLMARNSDLLYPLQPLSEDQVYERTVLMLEALYSWRDGLPDFLKPREKTLVGQRTFERQNTILKLAYAHLRILVTRRCLLMDFSRLGRSSPTSEDDRALKPIQECASAICAILDTIYQLSHRGSMYQAFWFTHYVALVALSTLYVFMIQNSRSSIPQGLFPDIDSCFDKAKYCQAQLAALSPNGSQARRHYILLDRLRKRAEKDAGRLQRDGHGPASMAPPPLATSIYEQTPAVSSAMADPERPTRYSEQTDESIGRPLHGLDQWATTNPEVPGRDMNGTMGQFTPLKDDYMSQNLLGWGWENLDTVGFPGEEDIFGFQA